MERYTIPQRVLIVKTFYLNNESIVATIRNLRRDFGRNNVPSVNTIRQLVRKFEQTGEVKDLPRSGRFRTVRTPENIERVRESVVERPETSTRHRSQELGIRRTSLGTILHKDLHLRPYKIQLTQELQPRDHESRRQYSHAILQLNTQNNDFYRQMIMSDEAHFDMNGFVNKQNCRIWALENPRVIHQRPLHPRRVTVWCGVWYRGVIGPYFFEDNAGNSLTVTGERYREMLQNFLAPQIQQFNLQNMWFQQDGATCHTARETMNLLRTLFPGRLISRFGDVSWPPRSPDLTAPDFFLWGFLKNKVYANKPNTVDQLKNNITEAIENIPPETYQKVMENVVKRAQVCAASRGGHLSDIIFHT